MHHLQQNKKYFRRGDLAAKQAEEYKKKQEVIKFSFYLQSQAIHSHHRLPYIFIKLFWEFGYQSRKMSLMAVTQSFTFFLFSFYIYAGKTEGKRGTVAYWPNYIMLHY